MERITTRVGWADFGDFEHFGVRLYRDLAGRVSFLQLAVFALGAGRLSDEDAAVLDDVASCCHVADPRIWPLKLARLVASAGRAVTGHLAACAVLDGDAIGAYAAEAAALVLLEARDTPEPAEADVAFGALLAGDAVPAGFGLQARRVDERVVALRGCVAARGRAELPFWRVAERLWAAAQRQRGLEPNAFGAIAAACLDVGLSPPQIGALTSILLQPSLVANAFEGAALRSAALVRLPPERVVYTGPAPRESPRAAEAGAVTRRPASPASERRNS